MTSESIGEKINEIAISTRYEIDVKNALAERKRHIVADTKPIKLLHLSVCSMGNVAQPMVK